MTKPKTDKPKRQWLRWAVIDEDVGSIDVRKTQLIAEYVKQYLIFQGSQKVKIKKVMVTEL